MKKNYDVWLMKQVEGSAKGDFEMIDTMVATSYRDAVKTAKELSLTWDACNVVCETWDNYGDYYILWKERYEHGKKQYRRIVESL
jgi:hypothetical protein